MLKNIVRAVVMSGAIAVLTTSPCGRRTRRYLAWWTGDRDAAPSNRRTSWRRVSGANAGSCRGHEASDGRELTTAQNLAFHGEPASLVASEGQSSRTVHRPEDAIFLAQIINDRLLVSIAQPENSSRTKASGGSTGATPGVCLTGGLRSTGARLGPPGRHAVLRFARRRRPPSASTGQFFETARGRGVCTRSGATGAMWRGNHGKYGNRGNRIVLE
jgi:hypothetical protein